MTERWVVVLEAVADGSGAIDDDLLDRLLAHVRDCNPRALHAADRYAVQLVVRASSSVGAHSAGIGRWCEAVLAIGAPAWSIVRVEAMTLDEFERDCRAGGPHEAITHDTALPRSTAPVADELLRSVFEDPITALPTAELFRAQVEAVLSRTQRPGTRHAMLMAHVPVPGAGPGPPREGFDDLMVRETVHRLRGMVRSDDVVARLDRDTFAIFVKNVGTAHAAALAERAMATVARALPDASGLPCPGGSVGLAFSRTGWDADRLFAAATVALELATRGGGGRWELFRSSLSSTDQRSADADEAESCADDY